MRAVLVLLVAGALPVAALAASADAPPTRKAGWWEITTTMNAPMVMTQQMHLCTDPATEARTNAFVNRQGPPPGAGCTDADVTRTAEGWRFSSVCRAEGMTMSTTGVATGDFETSYRVEAVNRMEPAPMPMMAETRMIVNAQWLGPCPAGRQPGDMVLGNGMVMNLNSAGR